MKPREPGKSTEHDIEQSSSQLLFRESEYVRADPIPLDILASELKRQSELLEEDRSSKYNSSDEITDSTSQNAYSGPDRSDTETLFAKNPVADLSEPTTTTRDARSMGDNSNASVTRPGFSSSTAPRRSSDVLTDRLAQIRHRAESAERERDVLTTEAQHLRAKILDLQQQLANALPQSNNNEAEALHSELELVRSKAAEDLNLLRSQLEEATARQPKGRDVELEAELQALRQETDMLGLAVKEKDSTLEELANQCRGLEDMLEDRDREMEKLYREIEHSRQENTAVTGQAAKQSPLEPASSPLYSFQEQESSEILDGSSLLYMPSKKTPWHIAALTGAGGLLLGLLTLEGLSIAAGNGELLSHLLGRRDAVHPAPVDPLPLTVKQTQAPPKPGTPPAAAPITAVKTPVMPAPLTEPKVLIQPTRPVISEGPKTFSETLRIGGTGPTITLLPGGRFTMGSSRASYTQAEQPVHEVEIRPFHMGTHEVSFSEYDLFARHTNRPLPNDEGWGRGNRPVINVSWDDARAYARWLSDQTGATYRLPSEAEWEYAARGGGQSRYWWGFSPGSNNAVCFNCGSRWDNRSTAPVGSLLPNAYGLQDTAGNVMEWVRDCYNPNYKRAPTDGSAWLSGDCSRRMVRGGAYSKPASSMRSAARSQLPKDTKFDMLGFRVVRE